MIFSYRSTRWKNEILEGWYKEIKTEDKFDRYPTNIFCLQEGFIQLVPRGLGLNASDWGHCAAIFDPESKIESKSRLNAIIRNAALSIFLATVRKHALHRAGSDHNPYDNAALGEPFFEPVYFRYGKGYLVGAGATPVAIPNKDSRSPCKPPR